MIRLPNPKSDIQEYIKIIAVINNYVQQTKNNSFNFDDISKNLTQIGNISSQKAFGSKAIEASFREDKSLDSVFNQSKALSEVLRLLGFIVSEGNQHTFRITQFGKYVASYHDTTRNDIRSEILNLISYVFLNVNFKHPQIIANDNISVKPFLATLLLLPKIENFITKEEFNFFILPLENDNDSSLNDTAKEILKCRTQKGYFQKSKQNTLQQRGVSENTASNYTRIPLAFYKSFNLLRKDTVKNIALLKTYLTDKNKYIDGTNANNSTEVYVLDSKGNDLINFIAGANNLKYKDIENESKEIRFYYAFSSLLFYYKNQDESILNFLRAELKISNTINKVFGFPYMILKSEEVVEFETLLESINQKFDISLLKLPEMKNQEIEFYIWNNENAKIQAELGEKPKIDTIEFGCLNCRPAKCYQYLDEELKVSNTTLQEIPDKDANNVCPTNAITFDSYLFPKLDYSKCVDCGICVSRCNYGAVHYENGQLVIKQEKSKLNLQSLKKTEKEAEKDFAKLVYSFDYKIDNQLVVEILTKFHTKVMNLKKEEFYPLVRNLLRQIHLKAKVGKSGDTQWRYDAIAVEPFVMPIEIKSPREDKFINPNSIRQAIENSITVEARHNLTKKALSAVIALLYANNRSDSEDMLKDAKELHNMKILLISVVVLSYLVLKNIENRFTVKDIEFIFSNTIGTFDEIVIKEFWINFLARREELQALDSKASYFTDK
ncbi:MAG: hypothetical protein EAZ20_12450, partial [Bacteroidetes bacterium]